MHHQGLLVGAGAHEIDLRLLRQVEPFPTNELVPYDTAFLSGHVVEHYQVVLLDAAGASKQQMHETLEGLCAAEIPGDTYRNLVVHTSYTRQTFKHILAPIWLMSYTYGARAFQCVQNGVTGAIEGEYPKSPWKIAAIVLVLFIIVVIVLSMGGR